MKCLSISFQPNRVPERDAAAVRCRLRALAAGWVERLNVDEGDDGGPDVNFTYTPRDLVGFWAHVRAEMGRDPLVCAALTRGSIIVSDDGGLIATLGVDDLVIVQSGGVTLVAKKDQLDKLKGLVEGLDRAGHGATL